MELSPKTKLNDLLEAYPFLLDFLIDKSPHFSNLKNPVMRKTIGKVATLRRAAAMGGLELNPLLQEIAREIEDQTGTSVAITEDDVLEATGPLDDPQAREEVLKGIIKDLHQGEDMEVLKSRFKTLVAHVSPSEIAHMEQKLIEEGMLESEVKRLCDVHVAVFKEALEKHEIPGAPAGHPVHTFMLENRAAEKITTDIDRLFEKLGPEPNEELFSDNRNDLWQLIDRLAEVHIHYLRKENQLFPLLEAHEISGPPQVMWAIHDDIRDLIKKAREQSSRSPASESMATLKEAVSAIREMIYKEEHILYPMSLETLTENDWGQVKAGEQEIGYAWIEPESDWAPSAELEPVTTAGEEKIRLDTGFISRDLINLMLTHLPVDITFVDAEDRVAYYSQGKERIFPRSPAIIGRKVQRCHPPDSVHIVTKILDAFKDGSKDDAEFWLQLGDKFILIRYFAVRDANGAYNGCLEVSQDITQIRKIEGQKRLLDWELEI